MESELKVKERDICVPGELLATGLEYIPGAGVYREGETLRAGKLGLVTLEGKVVKMTPLRGRYVPKLNDKVVARVQDILMSGWRVDMGSAWSAVLSLSHASSEYIATGADLSQYFALGDYLYCKIRQVTSQKLVDVTMRGPGLKKLTDGRIIEVNSMKVPRIIGKEGTMIGMVKQATDCEIAVGQNGWIFLKGSPEMELVAVEAIKMVEREAHTEGLTDRVKQFLKEKTGKDVEPRPEPKEEYRERPRPQRREGAFHGRRKPRQRGRRPQ